MSCSVEKPDAYANCHCSQCRKGGRPFASWTVFPATSVTVTGLENTFNYTSGKQAVNTHCKTCGTLLYKRPGGDTAPVYIINSQAFATDDQWKIPSTWGSPLNLFCMCQHHFFVAFLFFFFVLTTFSQDANRVVDLPGDASLKFINAPVAFGGNGELCAE